MALRFFRCIRVLGHGTLLCSAVVRLSVVSLALALASAHKQVESSSDHVELIIGIV